MITMDDVCSNFRNIIEVRTPREATILFEEFSRRGVSLVHSFLSDTDSVLRILEMGAVIFFGCTNERCERYSYYQEGNLFNEDKIYRFDEITFLPAIDADALLYILSE